MNNYKNYKDLDIWKKSFSFALMVFDLCKKINNNAINRVLINQIIRSVTSIAGNIAEGSGASTKKEFINYLQIARKSAIETNNWLVFIFSNNKVHKKSTELLEEKSVEIIKILTTIIRNSKK
ncbi:MAG: four helix bundle protein [bacterium]|nr:four helix bundle protein [bacterium]